MIQQTIILPVVISIVFAIYPLNSIYARMKLLRNLHGNEPETETCTCGEVLYATFCFAGTGAWVDPAPLAYEFTLLAAFAHSIAHPLSLLLLHHPLRDGLRLCLIEWCCCICLWLGMDFDIPRSPSIHGGSTNRRRDHIIHELSTDNHRQSRSHSFSRPDLSRSSHSPHPMAGLHRSVGDLVHIPGSGNLQMKRTTSLKSDRLLMSPGCGNNGPPSPSMTITDDMLPPPPLPPANSAFRKQVALIVPLHSLPYSSITC